MSAQMQLQGTWQVERFFTYATVPHDVTEDDSSRHNAAKIFFYAPGL